MSKLTQHSTTCALLSMETSSALIQLVTTSRGIVVDVQATNVDTEGNPHLSHALTKLSVDDAIRLELMLQGAIDASFGITPRTDARQTALWSNISFSEPVRHASP